MDKHLSLALILCTLAISGCQPSPSLTSLAQTQTAQAAFESAVAAAQTQAVPPSATPEPTQFIPPSPTQPVPTPTSSPADKVEGYLSSALAERTRSLAPVFHAEMGFIKYEPDNEGNPGNLYMILMRSEFTPDAQVLETVFTEIARSYSDPESRFRMPPTLKTFEIELRDLKYQPFLTYSGEWANVLALAEGRLSFDEFRSTITHSLTQP